jgi:membrane protein YdbS with pleckstrin-like domain
VGPLLVALAGRPGDRAAREVLGRPPRVTQCLGRGGRAAPDVAGHHDRDIPRQLVEAVTELPEGDVHADGVRPGRDLVGLTHIEEEHVLAAGEARLDLVGFHLGVGHGQPYGLRQTVPLAAGRRRYCCRAMALPRKFLNEDEELLAELHPHWIFLFGPLFTSIGVWAAIIVLVVLWRNPPGWTNYPILIVALIPGLWLLGRFVRWKSYSVALTSTRILVRQGILGRDTVQLRLQRITEVNIRQALLERLLGTGSLIIDVQGEDDSLTLEYMRKPAIVQRVINSQINEIVGGGRREPIPHDMLPAEARRAASRDYDVDEDRGAEQDTPPFGVSTPGTAPSQAADQSAGGQSAGGPAPGALPFEIRDRLIELDDLRRRGILSEEEFAAKKSELLNRI